MQEVIDKILFQMDRSQAAYLLYLKSRKYYQALRIYKANQQIYFLLNAHAHLWKNNDVNTIINYIFHLEDWFEQFDHLVNSQSPELNNEFIFPRLEDSPAFSKDFYSVIRNIKQT